ncbi:MAG: hypothetical protein ABF683_04060, partial [Sporolactobacillus sp.]
LRRTNRTYYIVGFINSHWHASFNNQFIIFSFYLMTVPLSIQLNPLPIDEPRKYWVEKKTFPVAERRLSDIMSQPFLDRRSETLRAESGRSSGSSSP